MSLSKAFGTGSLQNVLQAAKSTVSGSRMVDAVVTSKTAPVATTYRQPVEVVEDEGKIFPAPAVEMTPQKSVFASDTPMSTLPDPTLYQGKTVLTEASIANTGIVPPAPVIQWVKYATSGPVEPHGAVDGFTPEPWDWALFINQGKATNKNGMYRYDPSLGWQFVGAGDDDKVIEIERGSYKGKQFKKTYVDGVREYIDLSPSPVVQVSEAIKTATGFEIKPLYIIGAIVVLVGLWFAWKKGYLKA